MTLLSHSPLKAQVSVLQLLFFLLCPNSGTWPYPILPPLAPSLASLTIMSYSQSPCPPDWLCTGMAAKREWQKEDVTGPLPSVTTPGSNNRILCENGR